MTLSELLTTFAENILPIFLISGTAYLVGKKFSLDSRTVGRLVFYFFGPVLIFNLITKSQLPFDEMLKTAGYAAAVMLSCGLIAFLGGLALRLERRALMAVILVSMFANNGNFGLPLVSFAFGPSALAHSSIYFITSAVLINSVGVLVASLGHTDIKRALLGLLRVPLIYALIVALIVIRFELTLPVPLERSVTLVAGATVPMMLVLLGLELQKAQWTRNLRGLTLGTAVRLLVGPVIGLLLTSVMGITGAAKQGSVLEASMPSAVMNTVLAAEYNLDSSLVTGTILVTTLLSPLTLTPLILFLK
jgi:malate permease and related proteins